MTLGPLLLRVAVFGAIGLAVGAAYFEALRVNARLYLGGSGRVRGVGLHALRVALLAAALVVIARFGGLALVSALVGLLASRRIVVARIARTP